MGFFKGFGKKKENKDAPSVNSNPIPEVPKPIDMSQPPKDSSTPPNLDDMAKDLPQFKPAGPAPDFNMPQQAAAAPLDKPADNKINMQKTKTQDIDHGDIDIPPFPGTTPKTEEEQIPKNPEIDIPKAAQSPQPGIVMPPPKPGPAPSAPPMPNQTMDESVMQHDESELKAPIDPGRSGNKNFQDLLEKHTVRNPSSFEVPNIKEDDITEPEEDFTIPDLADLDIDAPDDIPSKHIEEEHDDLEEDEEDHPIEKIIKEHVEEISKQPEEKPEEEPAHFVGEKKEEPVTRPKPMKPVPSIKELDLRAPVFINAEKCMEARENLIAVKKVLSYEKGLNYNFELFLNKNDNIYDQFKGEVLKMQDKLVEIDKNVFS